MKIKVKKELPNHIKGPILLMIISEGKKEFVKASPGHEFEIEDKKGYKLLGEYSEILEIAPEREKK